MKINSSYLGYDVIAATTEEVDKPERTIPLSIILTLIIVTLSYIGVSAILTLMMPYYMIDMNAPFYYAFNNVDMNIIKYIVTIGAIISIIA